MLYTEREKQLLSIIESNISHYNGNRRKNRLSMVLYVADGNRVDVMVDGKNLFAGMLSIEEAHFFIFGITAYADRTGGGKR